MTFADFIKLPDYERLYTVEIKAGYECEYDTWVATGSGSYYMAFSPAAKGEVVEVEENGVQLAKVATIATCDSTASSFCYDFQDGRLYIHTSTGVSPAHTTGGLYDFVMMASFWVLITSYQSTDNPTIYTPNPSGGSDAATQPAYYLPYLDESSIPNLSQSVGEYYVGSLNIQFGQLKFINDGWWYKQSDDWNWHNRDIYVRIGARGSAYSDLLVVFFGKTRNPRYSDSGTIIETVDQRVSAFRELPIQKFWVSNYAHLEEGAEGQPIPALFGQVAGIRPFCIDTTAHKYKVSDAVFGGVAFGIEAITAVYKDKTTTLTLTTDYTVDLANGEFTLTADPGTSVITCDAKGLKCDVNWAASPLAYTSAKVYSENVADILFFVLVTLNQIPVSQIDGVSFADLNGSRSTALAWYLNEAMPTIDFNRMLQSSAVYQLVPLTTNKYGAFRYVGGALGTEPVIRSEDLLDLSIVYVTDAVFYQVRLRYGRVPSTGEWLAVESNAAAIKNRYKENETLVINSAIRIKAEAQNTSDFFLSLVQSPVKRIEGTIPPVGLSLKPTDKIIVSKSIIDAAGESVAVLTSEMFRVFELRKNIAKSTADIVAIQDIQSIGNYCEKCYTCQICNLLQGGACAVCVTCQGCFSGQCTTCMICNACQYCNTGQCAACQTCNTCQLCNTAQCTTCMTCVACQLCNTGQCGACMICVACQKCNAGQCATCQLCNTGQCSTCQSCNTCQLCNSAQCSTCQSCNTCMACVSAQCSTCMSCVACESCNTCTAVQCSNCNTCQLCVSGQCASCQSCNTCMVCNACQTSQCTSCQSCYSCQACNTGQCGTCMTCVACQICNTCQTSQCTACQSCYTCQHCVSGQCASCQSCNTCQHCYSGQCATCQLCNTGQCATCQSCVACQLCVSGQCASCQSCNTCQACVSGQCGTCMACVACQQCNTGQCTTCQNCVTCQGGCYTCQYCDYGQCSSCQNCDSCQGCYTGQCTTCMTCVFCEVCQSDQCHSCQACDSCQHCDSCQFCYGGES